MSNKRLLIRKRIKRALINTNWYKATEKNLQVLADIFDDKVSSEELNDFLELSDEEIVSRCEVYRK